MRFENLRNVRVGDARNAARRHQFDVARCRLEQRYRKDSEVRGISDPEPRGWNPEPARRARAHGLLKAAIA